MSRTLNRVLPPVLLAAALLAQEPVEPAFQANTRLVLVPFNVQRGKDFVADLQPSDFILREDGHPRAFTTFEGPHTKHPLPLELILLFDTTTVPVKVRDPLFHWNPKTDYEFIGDWDERLTGGLLQKNGMDIRLSVYHYAGHQLERLCAATSNPREIGQAFQALLDPIPQGKGELTLLPGDHVRKPMFDAPWQGWMTEAIVTTLKDASASPVAARRVLLFFTAGAGGTNSTGLQNAYSNMAGPALALNTPLDPVMMDQYRMNAIANRPGPGGVLATVDMPEELARRAGYTGTAYKDLPWVAAVGGMTGGAVFVPPHLDREALAAILKIARDTTLSQYIVGFTPEEAAKAKKHSLEVTLKSKSSGKLVGGEKNGVVY
ncbi:MAG TPA: hypothetical protein VN519_17175 [Bryobacteraceae bacterium]|nr:hypothetical protein [Bryobacteraceae bacterium]